MNRTYITANSNHVEWIRGSAADNGLSRTRLLPEPRLKSKDDLRRFNCCSLGPAHNHPRDTIRVLTPGKDAAITRNVTWGTHSISSETNWTPDDGASDASCTTGDDNDALSEDSDDSSEDSDNDLEDGGNNTAYDSTESSGDYAGPENSSEDSNSCSEDSELAIDDSDYASAECSNDDGKFGSSDTGPDASTASAKTQPSSPGSQSQDEGSGDPSVTNCSGSKKEEFSSRTTNGETSRRDDAGKAPTEDHHASRKRFVIQWEKRSKIPAVHPPRKG